MHNVPNSLTPEEIVALVTNVIACMTSLKSMKMPNWLTFPAAFIGLVVNSLHNNPLAAISGYLLLILVSIVFAKGRYPMGVVKLLAANGAALGPLVGSINFGVFVAVHFLLALTMVKASKDASEKEKVLKQQIPLGPMILIATVITIGAKRILCLSN